MKKVLIVIAVLFITATFAKAQEAQKNESKSENTVKSEEIQKTEPAKENTTVPQEAKKEEPVKAAVPAVNNDKKPEINAETKSGKNEYLADLSGKDENKIITATEWLAEKEEKSAVPQLVNLLKNDNRVKVRAYASIALGVIGDESCIPALNEALLNDSSADVRYAVLLAIHRINPAKSLDALKKAKETESDPYIKDYIEKMEAKWKEKK